MNEILKINNLDVSYYTNTKLFKKEELKAVDNVSFTINYQDIFGIVGESGCGKSTLCNAILGFVPLKNGEITLFDKTINNKTTKKELKVYRHNLDVIFQNPYSSLNPRFPIWKIVSEPLYLKGIKNEEILKSEALKMMMEVGLNMSDLNRYVFEFSGGQMQRIAIARSLINKPKFIILDEPTSALDVSIQAQIANLLKKLKATYSLTYLLVSHNLSLIYQLTNKVGIMYCGSLVEVGDTLEVLKKPLHPYTRGLISAVLDPKKDQTDDFYYDLKGEVSFNRDNTKCPFYHRCPYKDIKCNWYNNNLIKIKENHFASCLKAQELLNNKSNSL